MIYVAVSVSMEFHEKLQELRKRKGLTQEELAQELYVSRTAVSKWESGRGIPNIESLKAISKYFCVSLDDLFSGEEILAIAETDHIAKEKRIRDMVFGLLDCSMALLLFLPFFGQKSTGSIQAVSLLALQEVPLYLNTTYYGLVFAMTVLGVLTLALQSVHNKHWLRSKSRLSSILSAAGVCLFIITKQPYAAVFTFSFLLIKAFMLIKRH